jgi:hypothetical protein
MKESNRELELLESATSHSSGAELPAGEERELRENWLALSRLAERAAAQQHFDEAAFLAKVSDPVVTVPAASRRGWQILIGALAASVLIALLAAGYVAGERWMKSLADGPRSRPAVGERPLEHPLVAPGAVPDLRWDDSLDLRLDYVQLTMYELESARYSGDRSLQALGAQLEQFGSEIDGGSL